MIHIACTLIYDIKCNMFEVCVCVTLFAFMFKFCLYAPHFFRLFFSFVSFSPREPYLFVSSSRSGRLCCYFQFNQFKFILNSQLTEQDYFHRYRSDTAKEKNSCTSANTFVLRSSSSSTHT